MTIDRRSLLLSMRNWHFMAVDLLILAVSPAVAMLMRLDSFGELGQYAQSIALYTWLFIILKLALFGLTGLYSCFWPYASVDALRILARSAIVALGAEVALFFLVLAPPGLALLPQHDLPRSLPIIDAVVSLVLVGATRLAVRMLFEFSEQKKGGAPLTPVLIAGAGVAGAMIVRELRMNPQVGLTPVAFLDDDKRLHGRRIHGVMVVGPLSSLPEAVKQYHTRQVIIAMPTAPGKVVRDLVAACKQANVTGRTVPGLFELASGSARVLELREVQIEDLLRRGQVESDPEEVRRLIKGKCVLVTGAGGSIGSELSRQIALSEPGTIILLGHGENSIFKIANEIKKRLPENGRVRAVIADIRDKRRMAMVFRAYQPQIVFHAAAHKHVGLMQLNVADAVTNNVLGTRNIVELAAQFDIERFVMISSDKAVNPTSIMGVTKRIAELVVHDAAITSGKPLVSVRFGNVLGSRGSVVPIFKAQIAAGGPVTVSDPGVTRFFMTIPEAVQLVLHAGALGTGGEVFVLDMGEPIKILDLARDVIRLSGLTEGRDIDIVFTGLQQGEKLYEELFRPGETPERSRHPKIFVCENGGESLLTPVLSASGVNGAAGPIGAEGDVVLRQRVQELVEAVQFNSIQPVQELIKRIVPEYQSFQETPQQMVAGETRRELLPAAKPTILGIEKES
jgi:FlaA1/EpsC-like NDP-sugar epimerase